MADSIVTAPVSNNISQTTLDICLSGKSSQNTRFIDKYDSSASMCLFPGGISSTADPPPEPVELIREALSSLSNVTTNGSMRRVSSNNGMMFAYAGDLFPSSNDALYQFKAQVKDYIDTNNNAIYCNDGSKTDTLLDPALSVVASSVTSAGSKISNFCFKCCPSGVTCTSITEGECNNAVKGFVPISPTPSPPTPSPPTPSPTPPPPPNSCNSSVGDTCCKGFGKVSPYTQDDTSLPPPPPFMTKKCDPGNDEYNGDWPSWFPCYNKRGGTGEGCPCRTGDANCNTATPPPTPPPPPPPPNCGEVAWEICCNPTLGNPCKCDGTPGCFDPTGIFGCDDCLVENKAYCCGGTPCDCNEPYSI